MRTALLAAAATVLFAPFALALDKPLNIEVTSEAKCTRKSQRGDKVDVHYRGTLESDGASIANVMHNSLPIAQRVMQICAYSTGF